MKKVLVLVEGQTEETIVRDLLGPYLEGLGIVLIHRILETSRVKSGQRFKGGVTTFAKVKRDLLSLLGDTSAAAVTTLIDYYGLPKDFPGLHDRPPGGARVRVEHVEDAFKSALNHPRFIPHLTLHETEAWVFVSPGAYESVSGTAAQKLQRIRSMCGGAENIDDGPETAPSKRILEVIPRYAKPIDTPQALQAIGVEAIRLACPHMDAWLRLLQEC